MIRSFPSTTRSSTVARRLLVTAVFSVALAAPSTAGAADFLIADHEAFGGSGGVIKVDGMTGERTVVSENQSPTGGPSFVDPSGIARTPSGDLLVVDAADFGDFAAPAGAVIRVDRETGARTTLSDNQNLFGGPSFVAPFGIDLAPNGDALVVDPSAFPDNRGGVIRVDRLTGQRTLVSNNASPTGEPRFSNPAGVARAPNGDLYVVDPDAFANTDGGVIRVDRLTGQRTTVSENQSPTGGPSFVDPLAIARAPNGDLLVADENAFGGSGGVIRVDRDTGERTTVSQNQSPIGGPSFSAPTGIALLPNGDIVVTDGAGASVIRVDRNTGERTLVSDNQSPPGGPSFAIPVGIAVEPGS